MKRVTRSLTSALIVAAVMLVPPAFNRGTLSSQSASASRSSAKSDRARFVGTYELVTTEAKDPATGKMETWYFQGNGPSAYHRAGIYKEDWKIGENVTVSYLAAKDGSKHLGFMKMIKYADGHMMVFRVGGE